MNCVSAVLFAAAAYVADGFAPLLRASFWTIVISAMNAPTAILYRNSDIFAEKFATKLQCPQYEVISATITDSVVQGDGYHFLSAESAVANEELWHEHVKAIHSEEPISAAVYDSCMCCLTDPYWYYEWEETDGKWEKQWYPTVYRDRDDNVQRISYRDDRGAKFAEFLEKHGIAAGPCWGGGFTNSWSKTYEGTMTETVKTFAEKFPDTPIIVFCSGNDIYWNKDIPEVEHLRHLEKNILECKRACPKIKIVFCVPPINRV